MSYFKSKLRAISREYTKRDRDTIIAAAGGKCPMCSRRAGDIFVFGPTNYLKQQIRFRVSMDIHVIESSIAGKHLVVLCSGCHLSYHLFNRLSESADMGGKKLSDTLYKRCPRCKELRCMCCPKCKKLPKWCACGAQRQQGKTTTRRVRKCKAKVPKSRRLKLRGRK